MIVDAMPHKVLVKSTNLRDKTQSSSEEHELTGQNNLLPTGRIGSVAELLHAPDMPATGTKGSVTVFHPGRRSIVAAMCMNHRYQHVWRRRRSSLQAVRNYHRIT